MCRGVPRRMTLLSVFFRACSTSAAGSAVSACSAVPETLEVSCFKQTTPAQFDVKVVVKTCLSVERSLEYGVPVQTSLQNFHIEYFTRRGKAQLPSFVA